ncbi:MAG: hypothetical protein V4714_20455 [Bacteroidota bacterium]
MNQISKRMKCLLVFGLAIVFLSACQAQKYTPSDFQGKQLTFGSGGGFTGQVIQYTLLENGQLFQSHGLTKEVKELKGVSRTKSEQLFGQAEKLDLAKLDFNHPGNLYHFIHIKRGNTIQKVTWGSIQDKVPSEVEALYQELKAVISTN